MFSGRLPLQMLRARLFSHQHHVDRPPNPARRGHHSRGSRGSGDEIDGKCSRFLDAQVPHWASRCVEASCCRGQIPSTDAPDDLAIEIVGLAEGPIILIVIGRRFPFEGSRQDRIELLGEPDHEAARSRAAGLRIVCRNDIRAPVIVGGLVTLGAFMDCFGLLEVEASERDILHGAALLAAGPIV
jgi:hypothetical protein